MKAARIACATLLTLLLASCGGGDDNSERRASNSGPVKVQSADYTLLAEVSITPSSPGWFPFHATFSASSSASTSDFNRTTQLVCRQPDIGAGRNSYEPTIDPGSKSYEMWDSFYLLANAKAVCGIYGRSKTADTVTFTDVSLAI